MTYPIAPLMEYTELALNLYTSQCLLAPSTTFPCTLHVVMPITRITTCIPFPLCCPELMRKGTKAEDELRFLNGGQS